MPEDDDPIAALRAANPIDEHEVSAAWLASPLRTQLLEEIEMSDTATTTRDAPPAQHTPTSWRVARIGAAAAVLAMAVLLLPAPFGAGTSAYAIRPLDDGRIHVTIEDFADGDALATDLQEFGIDITVRPEVASPSQVGRVIGTEGVGVGVDGQLPVGMTVAPDGEEFSFTIDPDLFAGSLTMHVGVAAAQGEDYTVAASAFAEGEPLAGLHCSTTTQLTADQLADAARQAGLDVEWTVITEVTPDATGSAYSSAEVANEPEGRILSAHMRNADVVRVEVVPFDLTHGDLLQLNDPDEGCTN